MDGLELRVFRADTIAQALALVRRELGPDAIILQTRQLTKQGFTGPKTYSVEITAATDPAEIVDRLPRSGDSAVLNEAPVILPLPQVFGETPPEMVYEKGVVNPAVAAAPAPPKLDPIQQQIDSLTSLVRDLYEKRASIWTEEPSPAPIKRPTWDSLEKHLRRAELPEEIVRDCLQHAERFQVHHLEPNDPAVVDSLVDMLGSRISIAPRQDAGREVLGFVGPPGCGKTTTLAKLASIASIEEARKVAILTLDTYRVGAAEQLRAYANILDVPFEIVYTPTQLEEALKRHADADTVLIDTAGRCSVDEKRISQLGLFLSQRAQVHLVLGVDMRDSALTRVLRRFEAMTYHRVILTKLDQIAGCGVIAGVAAQLSVPISYVAVGPEVPGDLLRAEREALSRLSLGYSRLEPLASPRMTAA